MGTEEENIPFAFLFVQSPGFHSIIRLFVMYVVDNVLYPRELLWTVLISLAFLHKIYFLSLLLFFVSSSSLGVSCSKVSCT